MQLPASLLKNLLFAVVAIGCVAQPALAFKGNVKYRIQFDKIENSSTGMVKVYQTNESYFRGGDGHQFQEMPDQRYVKLSLENSSLVASRCRVAKECTQFAILGLDDVNSLIRKSQSSDLYLQNVFVGEIGVGLILGASGGITMFKNSKLGARMIMASVALLTAGTAATVAADVAYASLFSENNSNIDDIAKFVVQSEGTETFGFVPDLDNFINDISVVSAQAQKSIFK